MKRKPSGDLTKNEVLIICGLGLAGCIIALSIIGSKKET